MTNTRQHDSGLQAAEPSSSVGYKRPPAHARFKPGQSGNPSGRAKGSKNLKTIFEGILKEKVTLREGNEVKNVTKAEALMRGLVVGALKGDHRSIGTLFRIAEQAGHFTEPSREIAAFERVVFSWKAPDKENDPTQPVIRELSRD